MTRTCVVCGKEFPYGGRRTRRRYCSRVCRSRMMNAVEWNRQPNPPLSTTRYCVGCRTEFVPRRTPHIYCTGACRNRCYVKARRGKGSLRIDAQLLWWRDHGWCYLCSRLVDRELVYPDPGAPTIDHIVPLSLGGEHTMGNLGLTHWECNRKKGAGVR